MPHPTVIGDANTVRTDVESPVEIIKIVNRPFLFTPIACRSASGQQGSSRGIGHVEPVPVGTMNRDYPPINLCESERERDCLRVVSAAVKHEGHPAGSEVDDLAVTAIVIDDRGELATWR